MRRIRSALAAVMAMFALAIGPVAAHAAHQDAHHVTVLTQDGDDGGFEWP